MNFLLFHLITFQKSEPVCRKLFFLRIICFYRAMKIADEAEERIKKEEAMKRAESEGAEIGFDYDNPGGKKQETENAAPEISLHQLATLIEKTSEFIATQGAQMSILMRAKEAHNPKFQFLNPGNPYHPIYIQVLETKKARFAGRLPTSNVPEVPSIGKSVF